MRVIWLHKKFYLTLSSLFGIFIIINHNYNNKNSIDKELTRFTLKNKQNVFYFIEQPSYTQNEICRDGIHLRQHNDANKRADFAVYLGEMPDIKSINAKYKAVFEMESEHHSSGTTWSQADFRMWYNLDLSFPEPATYFDVHTFLVDLLSPPLVEFSQKLNDSSLVFVNSNCGAPNGRQTFVKSLMGLAKVDSYGKCLQNKFNHPSEHMKGNIDLFSKYKFVIAIENSNCVDYVTEKLVHAVKSGSIPIVAGYEGKPDYLRFMPVNSYINIFDFENVTDLVEHLRKVGSNAQEYEKYLYFKKGHSFTKDYLSNLDLDSLVNLAKEHFKQFDERMGNEEQTFFSHIVLKEKSENKLCKIARYLRERDDETIQKEITDRRSIKPESTTACLPGQYFAKFFKI